MKFKTIKHWDCGNNSQIYLLEDKHGGQFEVSLSKNCATVFANKKDIMKLFNLDGSRNDEH